MSLKQLLRRAWDAYYEIDGPGWLDSRAVTVDATMPPDTTKAQFQQMLRNLITCLNTSGAAAVGGVAATRSSGHHLHRVHHFVVAVVVAANAGDVEDDRDGGDKDEDYAVKTRNPRIDWRTKEYCPIGHRELAQLSPSRGVDRRRQFRPASPIDEGRRAGAGARGSPAEE